MIVHHIHHLHIAYQLPPDLHANVIPSLICKLQNAQGWLAATAGSGVPAGQVSRLTASLPLAAVSSTRRKRLQTVLKRGMQAGGRGMVMVGVSQSGMRAGWVPSTQHWQQKPAPPLCSLTHSTSLSGPTSTKMVSSS